MSEDNIMKAVEDILEDVQERKGWREAWDGTDEDGQKDIKRAWADIIYNRVML